MNEFCPDKDCNGLLLVGICNQCGTDWTIMKPGVVAPMKDDMGNRVIKVSGLMVTVKEVTLGLGQLGQCSLEKSEILVDEHIAKDLKDETLLHEVIHFISMCNALELDEQQVATLASDLTQYLKDNKQEI